MLGRRFLQRLFRPLSSELSPASLHCGDVDWTGDQPMPGEGDSDRNFAGLFLILFLRRRMLPSRREADATIPMS